MNNQKDKIYSQAQGPAEPFAFDEKVVRVFPDMIARSVPGYPLMLDALGLLAKRHVQAASNIYDLGCSLGAATLSVRHNIVVKDCRIIGVDNSQAMIERCASIIEADTSKTPVQLQCADILDIKIENASLVILNFTLQFIEREDRLALLQKIRKGMCPGGVLFLAEKVHFEEAQSQAFLDLWHLDFKRSQGYSDLEIAQKRQALEEVLRSDTIEQHQQRLSKAGFEHSTLAFQCLNFAAIVATA